MSEVFVGLISFLGRNGDGLISAFGADSVEIKAGDRIQVVTADGGTGFGSAILPFAATDDSVVQGVNSDLTTQPFIAAVFRRL